MIYSRIVGTGGCLPAKVLTNADLEKMVDTSDTWIVERTGIKERHLLAENEVLSDMTEVAARQAIEAAGIDKEEIDLIIVATVTSELIFPSAACVLQKRLGIKNNCPAFDLSAACTGSIYGLRIADNFIKSGTAKCVLLVGADALSKVTDWTDRATCVILADGAGAMILKNDKTPGVRSVHVHADGSYGDLLYAKNCVYGNKPYTHMRGNELFKLAVNKLSTIVQETLDHNNITSDEIDWLVPHQANLRIIMAMAKKLNLSLDRVIVTIREHGNTSAAAVLLALDTGIRDGRIKHGDTLLMEVFGAGLTWGSALIDY